MPHKMYDNSNSLLIGNQKKNITVCVPSIFSSPPQRIASCHDFINNFHQNEWPYNRASYFLFISFHLFIVMIVKQNQTGLVCLTRSWTERHFLKSQCGCDAARQARDGEPRGTRPWRRAASSRYGLQIVPFLAHLSRLPGPCPLVEDESPLSLLLTAAECQLNWSLVLSILEHE